MSNAPFRRRPEDPGYIVAWRDRYEHVAGRFEDDVMTYGEACEKARALGNEHPERVFWAELLKVWPPDGG